MNPKEEPTKPSSSPSLSVESQLKVARCRQILNELMGMHFSKTENNVYFYKPSIFKHLDVLTKNYDVIVEELQLALKTDVVSPDVENGAEVSGIWCGDSTFDEFYERTRGKEGWLHWWSVNNPECPNTEWTIFGLIQKGKKMTENCKCCPKTTKLLEQVPGIRVAGFSRMQPNSNIETHKGFTGRKYGSLAYHLGLVIPPSGASLVCGPEVHKWTTPGEVIVFDDTWPHSAHNESDQERIILYIDFTIPEDVKDNLPPMEDILKDDDDNDDTNDDGEKWCKEKTNPIVKENESKE